MLDVVGGLLRKYFVKAENNLQTNSEQTRHEVVIARTGIWFMITFGFALNISLFLIVYRFGFTAGQTIPLKLASYVIVGYTILRSGALIGFIIGKLRKAIKR